jgi:TRAP transporter 4TM/12TM fusion protein
MTMGIMKSLTRNASFMFGSQAMTWISSFVLMMFLPRYLGSEEYGRLFLAISMTMIFEVMINFGGQYHITKETARAPGNAPHILVNSVVLRTALWVMSIAAMVIVSILAGYPATVRNLIIILGVAKLWESISWVMRWCFQGFEQMEYPAAGSLVERLLLTIAGVGALLLGATSITIAIVIPLMKRYGFSPRFAGAVEASASCGGQVTPPVMGASAFVMAELLGVPYRDIVLIAIIPALFHYVACLTMVHLEAKRLRLAGVAPHLIPRLGPVIAQSWHLVFPLVAMVTMLLLDYTPFLAAFYGIVISIVVSYIPPLMRRVAPGKSWGQLQGETLTPLKLIQGFEGGAKYALAIGAACACVGLILGTLTLSGLGFKFAGAVVDLSGAVAAAFVEFDFTGWISLNGAKIFFGMLFVAIACILMGTGIPTTPTYIILASIAAPALATLGVPLIATHFFVFYYGVLADVTPPVALAAYAAAGIAGAEPMRTGTTAFRLSMGKALVPFVFVFAPSLLFINFDWGEFLMALTTGLLGVYALSVAYIGWFKARVGWLARTLLTISGLVLVLNDWRSNLAGTVVVLGVLVHNALLARRAVPGRAR